VTKGTENTSATAKDTGTDYELLLTPTAKIIEDIDANLLDTILRCTDTEKFLPSLMRSSNLSSESTVERWGVI
jgi:hypothetical protein